MTRDDSATRSIYYDATGLRLLMLMLIGLAKDYLTAPKYATRTAAATATVAGTVVSVH
jgi:hypothetical protein